MHNTEDLRGRRLRFATLPGLSKKIPSASRRPSIPETRPSTQRFTNSEPRWALPAFTGGFRLNSMMYWRLNCGCTDPPPAFPRSCTLARFTETALIRTKWFKPQCTGSKPISRRRNDALCGHGGRHRLHRRPNARIQPAVRPGQHHQPKQRIFRIGRQPVSQAECRRRQLPQ